MPIRQRTSIPRRSRASQARSRRQQRQGVLVEARRLASRARVRWPDVRDAYNELRAVERESRHAANTLRRRAWERFVTPGAAPFWRHGWQKRFSRVFDGGLDWRAIRGFDVLADGLCYEFPELANATCPAEALFEFLRQPYRRAKAPLDLYREAIERVQQSRAVRLHRPDTDGVPF